MIDSKNTRSNCDFIGNKTADKIIRDSKTSSKKKKKIERNEEEILREIYIYIYITTTKTEYY